MFITPSLKVARLLREIDVSSLRNEALKLR
jgi:hypothetical protein